MDAKGARFKNQDGKVIEHPDAIVPLISLDSNSEFYFIGTAFYITSNGLLMTAKHCLYDKDDNLLDNLWVYHFLPDGGYVIREIFMENVFISDDYDIAYLMPTELSDKGGRLLTNSALQITNVGPQIGDQLSTYAYPDSGIVYFDSGDSFHMFNANFFLGKCEDYHDKGCGILKNPCYQTSVKIKSGSSGGPVFNKDGAVFAVCSTGLDLIPGESDLSFVTPLAPSFNMTIKDATGKIYSIMDLINMKFINLHNSVQ